MASGKIDAIRIHDLKVVLSYKEISGKLTAHAGGGVRLTPTAPNGYQFLTHIACYNTGVVGIIASFDG